MSSWANRNIPRRRDLSQIPEGLRPQIIPRFQQPQVILSESFQVKPVNEVVYPEESSFEPAKEYRSYPVKKIEYQPAPSAVELTHKGLSYVFVILRHLRSARDNDLWISSYQSVRRFYTNPIIIIDDNSEVNTVNGKLVNTEVIYSEWNGAGEILPYYYFLKSKWADRMVFLHDSMFIYRPFRTSELEGPVRFHWHFDSNEIRNDRKIATYLSILPQSEVLMASMEDPEFTWKGCFGGASIIDLAVVEQLEEKYELFSKLIMAMRTRKDRETFERVFGIMVRHEGFIVEETTSNFGNIIKYPGAFESQIYTIEAAVHALSQKGYDTAIIKVWRGR